MVLKKFFNMQDIYTYIILSVKLINCYGNENIYLAKGVDLGGVTGKWTWSKFIVLNFQKTSSNLSNLSKLKVPSHLNEF